MTRTRNPAARRPRPRSCPAAPSVEAGGGPPTAIEWRMPRRLPNPPYPLERLGQGHVACALASGAHVLPPQGAWEPLLHACGRSPASLMYTAGELAQLAHMSTRACRGPRGAHAPTAPPVWTHACQLASRQGQWPARRGGERVANGHMFDLGEGTRSPYCRGAIRRNGTWPWRILGSASAPAAVRTGPRAPSRKRALAVGAPEAGAHSCTHTTTGACAHAPGSGWQKKRAGLAPTGTCARVGTGGPPGVCAAPIKNRPGGPRDQERG